MDQEWALAGGDRGFRGLRVRALPPASTVILFTQFPEQPDLEGGE
jgi:hypothetical protein